MQTPVLTMRRPVGINTGLLSISQWTVCGGAGLRFLDYSAI
jgi:hypothetical protein